MGIVIVVMMSRGEIKGFLKEMDDIGVPHEATAFWDVYEQHMLKPLEIEGVELVLNKFGYKLERTPLVDYGDVTYQSEKVTEQ